MTTIDRTDDLDLSALMTLDEAVTRFPYFRRDELLSAMRAGELRHWRKGRGRLVTEGWLKDYVRRQLRGGETGHWPDESRTSPPAGSRSEASGSPDTKPADDGSEIGMTREQEELGAGLLARAITRKPRRSSQQ